MPTKIPDKESEAYTAGMLELAIKDKEKSSKVTELMLDLAKASMLSITNPKKLSEDTVSIYSKALTLDLPPGVAAFMLHQRATTYLFSNKLAEAKEDATKIIQLAPDSAAGYYVYAQTCRAEGDNKTAVEYLHKALEKEPVYEHAKKLLEQIEKP